MPELPGSLGIQALINMLLTLIFITLSWWALQNLKLDLFIRNINSAQAKLLQVLLAVVIGYTVARFFIDYMQWTNWLKYLF